MTRERHDDKGTEFGTWLRTEHQDIIGSHTFCATDIDYIWHNYKENWFIIIEEKRFGGMRNAFAEEAQMDTQGVVHQLLQLSSGTQVVTKRGIRPTEYRGYYKIVFSGTSPVDSKKVTVNGKPVTRSQFIELLKSGRLVEQAIAA